MKRPGILATLLTLLAFSGLIALGVWQLHRQTWKTALLARIAALRTAPAEPLEVVLHRVQDRLDVSFTRVQADCPDIETTPVLRLYSIYQGQVGYHLVTICRLSSGAFSSILVDRGFVPEDLAATMTVGGGRHLGGPIVGILRQPDPRNFVTPVNQPGQNLWYWRDIPAMAAALHADRAPPATLMLESPVPPGLWPKPAPLPTDIPNNHFGYAITWFGLAAAMAAVYLALLFRRRPD